MLYESALSALLLTKGLAETAIWAGGKPVAKGRRVTAEQQNQTLKRAVFEMNFV